MLQKTNHFKAFSRAIFLILMFTLMGFSYVSGSLSESSAYYSTTTNTTGGINLIDSGVSFVDGMATNGTDIYIVDSNRDFIYDILINGTNTTLGIPMSVFRGAGTTTPRGIYSNGTDRFVVDQSALFVYQILPDGTNGTEGFALVGFGLSTPFGITGNITTFYISEYTDDMIYVFNGTGADRTNGTDGFSTLGSGAAQPTGLDSLGNDFYFADTTDDFFYNFNKITGTNGTEGFETASFGCTDPVGIAILNLTDFYVSDATDYFVYHLVRNLTLNIINQTWEETIFSGSSETFIINLLTGGQQVSSATLWYNNTGYSSSGITNPTGNEYIITRNLQIPTTSEHLNNSFFWEIKLNGEDAINLSSNTQQVFPLNIDDCKTYTNLLMELNYKDEDYQIQINPTANLTEIKVDINVYSKGLRTTPVINFSWNFTQINPGRICLKDEFLNNTAYEMDATVHYDSLGFVSEYYYFQNFSLTNASIPQNITLYGLEDGKSTEFLVIFKDSNLIPVENAIINLKRKYISEGVFKSVEMTKTDTYGKGKLHFDLDNNVLYSILVTKNGRILGTFDNIAVYCEDEVIGDCKIRLDVSTTTTPIPDFYTYSGLLYSLTFNETLRRMTLIFSTKDGSTGLISLNLTKLDNYGNLSLCASQLLSSSGTLTCTIPASYGNLTFLTEVFYNNELITSEIYFISAAVKEIFGDNLVVFAILLFLTLPLMLVTSMVGVMIGGIVGLIMGIVLIYLSKGLIGAGVFFIWGVIAAFIIIWKINQGRGT